MPKTHQEFMAQFDDERKPLVEAVLNAINEACPTLTEIIKWNAPSFCEGGKDRLTLMLHKSDRVGLILHTGARPKKIRKRHRYIRTIPGCWNGTRISGPRSLFWILAT